MLCLFFTSQQFNEHFYQNTHDHLNVNYKRVNILMYLYTERTTPKSKCCYIQDCLNERRKLQIISYIVHNIQTKTFCNQIMKFGFQISAYNKMDHPSVLT